MKNIDSLKIISADGVINDFRIHIATAEPWSLDVFGPDGSPLSFFGPDLFEALKAFRNYLEPKGQRPLCAGARSNVTPSGMSRSMGGGRKAYVIHLGVPASLEEMVDIFEYASPESVGTVQEQRAYIESWFKSLMAK
jgi:hypothetical protein